MDLPFQTDVHKIIQINANSTVYVEKSFSAKKYRSLLRSAENEIPDQNLKTSFDLDYLFLVILLLALDKY